MKIAGTEYPFKERSLRVSRKTHSRSTASFQIINRPPLVHFQFNQPVEIIDLDGTSLILAGWIDDVREQSWLTLAGVSEGLFHNISVKDNHYLADKRLVIEGPDGEPEFIGMTAGAIVTWIIDNILVDEGVTAGTITAGSVITRLPADHIACAEVIEQAADAMGFVWKINNDRSLDFRSRTAVSAPVVSYGTGMRRGTVFIRRRNFSYRNKQYVLGSDEVAISQPITSFGQVTNSVVGDGTARAFTFPFYMTHVYGIQVTRDGTTWTNETFTYEFTDTTGGFGAEQWHWGLYDNRIYQNPGGTVLDGTNDAVRIDAYGYPSVKVHTFLGDGSQRYSMPFYFSDPTRQVEPKVELDTGSTGTFARETVGELTASNPNPTQTWWYQNGNNQLIRNPSSTPFPTSADTIRVTYVDYAIPDITYANPDEIARNKTIEGDTTSGIVESIITDYESKSAAESTQKALAELNRWSHDSIELEFETHVSGLVDGEVATVNLPDHDIVAEDFLIDEVTIRDIPTQGLADTTSSPLLYRVTAIKSPAALAAGGAIGRAANPRRSSDLFRQLNDRMRLPALRPLTAIEVVEEEVPPETPPAGCLPDDTMDAGGFTARIWLKADQITGLADNDPVTTWEDQSTGGTHDFTQGTAANKPLYKTNRINSLPTVLFDGTNDVLTVAAGTAHMRVDSTLFVVLRLTGPFSTTNQSALGAVKGAERLAFGARRVSSGRMTVFSESDTTRESSFTPLANTFYLMVWDVGDQTGRIRFFVNGTQHGETPVTTIGDVDDATSTYYLAEGGIGTSYLKGEIAELAIWGDVMSDANRECLETYFMDKYALT